jgi:hypothetical protein
MAADPDRLAERALALRLHALQRALAPCSHEQMKTYPA